MGITIRELANKLDKLTPQLQSYKQERWYIDYQQLICLLDVNYRITIDPQEIRGKTDTEIKAFILKRFSDAMICTLNIVEEQLKEAELNNATAKT